MKRPIGFTISALILTWIAITGFMNGWGILSNPATGNSLLTGYIALIYAVAAIISAFGLWMMKKWSVIAVRCWMAACLLFIIIPEDIRNQMMQGGIAGMLGFFVFISIVFWFFDHYINSKLFASDGK